LRKNLISESVKSVSTPPAPTQPILLANSYDFLTDNQTFLDIGYLVYRECTPEWRVKDRLGYFNYWDITYLTKGAARYTIDGIPYELTAGDLLCFPAGHSREAISYPDNLMNCFAVNFSLKSIDNTKKVSIPLPLVSHIGLREDIIQLFNEMLLTWANPKPLYIFKLRALFMLILHRCMETVQYNISSTVNDTRIQKVLRYISSHYSEKITVKKMAELCNLNTVYFGSLFKQETGMTLLQYLTKIRIRYAEEFLRSGELRVNEVAERCGFSDIFYFYRHFKTIFGIAPSACIPRKSG